MNLASFLCTFFLNVAIHCFWWGYLQFSQGRMEKKPCHLQNAKVLLHVKFTVSFHLLTKERIHRSPKPTKLFFGSVAPT